jgi:hypothetical protein
MKNSSLYPVRTETRGRRAVKSRATASVSPGATGRGSTTSATVRSSGLPSSGAMKRIAGSRSVPSGPVIRVTSIAPHESGSRPSRCSPPDSRQNVESVLRNAFKYRWKRSVGAAFDVVFFHVSTSLASIVFFSASRRQVIW